MSAIISAYLPLQGFVIGADGRQCDRVAQTTNIEDAQKIFFVERPGISLAYAWAGITFFADQNGKKFDLLAASEGVWLLQVDRSDFSSFVWGFATEIYNRLIAEIGGNDVSEFPMSADFCKLLVVGYFHNQPYKAEIKINNLVGRLLSPVVTARGVPVEDFCTFNSPAILGPFAPSKITSLQDASESIEKYIRTAAENEEDDECKQVGGHTHVASVTPSGCKWVVKPVGLTT